MVGIGAGCGSPDKVADLQVFHDQQAVVGDEGPGRVMVEVSSLVGELAITGRDHRSGVATVVGTSLLAGQDLLGGAQPGGGDPPPARIGKVFAIGSGGEAGDPDVDADRGPGGLQGPRRHLVTGQDQHPPAPFAADLDGLDPAVDLAVDGDLSLPDPLQIDPADLGLPAAAVAVLGPFDTVEAVRRLEPRIAGRLPGSDSPVEAGEGPVQTAQGRLLGRERPRRDIRSDRADVFELGRLVPVRDAASSAAATRPVVPAERRCRAPGARPSSARGRHAGARWAAAETRQPRLTPPPSLGTGHDPANLPSGYDTHGYLSGLRPGSRCPAATAA